MPSAESGQEEADLQSLDPSRTSARLMNASAAAATAGQISLPVPVAISNATNTAPTGQPRSRRGSAGKDRKASAFPKPVVYPKRKFQLCNK